MPQLSGSQSALAASLSASEWQVLQSTGSSWTSAHGWSRSPSKTASRSDGSQRSTLRCALSGLAKGAHRVEIGSACGACGTMWASLQELNGRFGCRLGMGDSSKSPDRRMSFVENCKGP